MQQDAEIIIIGAGMAGLAAAQHLQAGGVNNILILEGSDRVGGRVKNIKFAGLTMPAGASWIHGIDPTQPELHPLYQLSLKHGGPLRGMSEKHSLDTAYDNKGNKYNGPLRLGQLSSGLEDSNKLARKNLMVPEGVAKGTPLRDGLTANGWNPTTPADNWLEWLNVDFMACKAENVSLCAPACDKTGSSFIMKESDPVDYFITDSRGYSYLAECLKDDVLKTRGTSLVLNSVVKEINWGDESCVSVTVSNGQKYTAKNAILTASIGVLKSKSIQFVPELPMWKNDVIQRFGNNRYAHVLVEFSEVFWDDTDRIGYIDLEKGTYPIFFNFHNRFSEKPAVLMAEVTGDQGEKVSTQPKEVTLSEITTILSKIYPGKNIEILDARISGWITDPLFMGSYSFFSKEMSFEDFKLLGAPVKGLFFSGEATSPYYQGYVHGAYYSGIDSADSILKMRKLEVKLIN